MKPQIPVTKLIPKLINYDTVIDLILFSKEKLKVYGYVKYQPNVSYVTFMRNGFRIIHAGE